MQKEKGIDKVKKIIEELTLDGSPTLYFDDYPEKMHHSGGAASETIYIYGEALSEALNLSVLKYTPEALRAFVFGLGLGYIETLICLKTNFQFEKILSCEKEVILIKQYSDWIKDLESAKKETVQDRMFSGLRNQLQLSGIEVDEINSFREKMKLKLNQNKIVLKEAFEFDSFKNEGQFHLINFDAFSNTTDRHFWSENFFDQFIQNHCAPQCVFATYAKTGALTRTLKKHGFTVKNKSGFSGKRESTLAIRS